MALKETSSKKLCRRCLSSSPPVYTHYQPALRRRKRRGLTRNQDPLLERRLKRHVLDHPHTLQHLIHKTDSLIACVHLRPASAPSRARANGQTHQTILHARERLRGPVVEREEEDRDADADERGVAEELVEEDCGKGQRLAG